MTEHIYLILVGITFNCTRWYGIMVILYKPQEEKTVVNMVREKVRKKERLERNCGDKKKKEDDF